MKKLQFQTSIDAPAEKVYNSMLNKANYEKWTTPFSSTSSYEGNWEKGSKIYFTSLHEGKRMGMVSRIAENIPNKYLSIEHYGMLEGDVEKTSGPGIDEWAGAQENYTFKENNGVTELTVDLETEDDWVSHMEEGWPKSLQILKDLVEKA